MIFDRFTHSHASQKNFVFRPWRHEVDVISVAVTAIKDYYVHKSEAARFRESG